MAEGISTNFSKRLGPLPVVRITLQMRCSALLLLIAAGITGSLARYYPPDAPLHHDIFDPTLALELPHSAKDLRVVLSPPLAYQPGPDDESPAAAADREAGRKAAQEARENEIRALFGRATAADFFFVAAYTWFFLATWSALQNQRTEPRLHTAAPMSIELQRDIRALRHIVLGPYRPFRSRPVTPDSGLQEPAARGRFTYPVAALVLIAAGSDIVENIGILRALGTGLNQLTDTHAATIRWASTVKWGALALVAFFLARALTRIELMPFRRPGTGVLAIVLYLAAFYGVTGLSPDQPSVPGMAGWLSHRHLEVFVLLMTLLPMLVIAAGIYDLLKPQRAAQSSSAREPA